jgi:hypothetical protein
MSITVLQKPSDIQPAQSPVVFSVVTSGSNAYTASGFQYTANLYVWSGTYGSSGSYLYQTRKYPNSSGSGIFDFGKLINSTLKNLAGEDQSNVKFYKVEFGFQYESGSTYVTQSGGLIPVSCSVGGSPLIAYDGYALFPDAINESLVSQSAVFPFMTDAYLVTQSIVDTDTSAFGPFASRTAGQGSGSHGISVWRGDNDSYTASYILALTASYTNGTQASGSTAVSNLNLFTDVSGTLNAVGHYGFCPRDPGWIANFSGVPTASLDNWNFTIYNSGVALGTLNYEVVCPHYYEPVRIAFKNRFGQFDFLNFYKRHNETFNTDQRIYQPQLGTWGGQTLGYNQLQTRTQRYIVDASEVLECNTDWLEEGWNVLMRQLLVSDEIYWMYDQSNPNNVLVKPLTIQTNSLQFKTGVNNKLIQYTITFDIGQPYKLIL